MIREHDRGRDLAEILEDRYVQNRLTPDQRARLLDRPEVIKAIGNDTIADARHTIRSSRQAQAARFGMKLIWPFVSSTAQRTSSSESS